MKLVVRVDVRALVGKKAIQVGRKENRLSDFEHVPPPKGYIILLASQGIILQLIPTCCSSTQRAACKRLAHKFNIVAEFLISNNQLNLQSLNVCKAFATTCFQAKFEGS